MTGKDKKLTDFTFIRTKKKIEMKWTKQVTWQFWCKSIFSEFIGHLVFSCALACAKREQQRTTGKKIWLSMHKKKIGSEKIVRSSVSQFQIHPSPIHPLYGTKLPVKCPGYARWGWWFCSLTGTVAHARPLYKSWGPKIFLPKEIRRE